MSSFSINRVVLVGRLTRDPELRSLPSGASVANLRIACNGSRKDADGSYSERPNYFDVSVFGAPAESVDRYMRKGSRIAVDGHLEWREWETAEQQRRQAVSVVAETVQFLDSPSANRAGDGSEVEGGGDGESEDRELVGAGAGEDLSF
jgi:single-strand DNA-binding protein